MATPTNDERFRDHRQQNGVKKTQCTCKRPKCDIFRKYARIWARPSGLWLYKRKYHIFESDQTLSSLPSMFHPLAGLLCSNTVYTYPDLRLEYFSFLPESFYFVLTVALGLLLHLLALFFLHTCAECYKANGHSRHQTPAAAPNPEIRRWFNTAASPKTASNDKTVIVNVPSSQNRL